MPSQIELEKAYYEGWADEYDDLMYNNTYDEKSQPELYEAYDSGFDDGSEDC